MRSADGPRSIKEFNSKITALAESGNSGELKNSGDLSSRIHNETDDPLHIHGDAGDLLPQSNAEHLVLEIVEGSKHSVGLIARAMSQPMGTTAEQNLEAGQADGDEEGQNAHEGGLNPEEEKLADSQKERLGTSKDMPKSEERTKKGRAQQERRGETEEEAATRISEEQEGEEDDEDMEAPIVIGLEEAEEEAKATKKIWNATSRRRGAFRRGLVRCVMVMHEAFLKQLGPDYQDFDPLKEGQWQAGFSVASLSLAEVLKAAEEAAEQLASAEQSGRVK